jgi:hypothetical protein
MGELPLESIAILDLDIPKLLVRPKHLDLHRRVVEQCRALRSMDRERPFAARRAPTRLDHPDRAIDRLQG